MRAEYKDVSEVINLFNNISWRIIANNKIVDADESNWITKETYNESITKVIAKAVADCVTDKNEFANKGESDVITFGAKAETYDKANWNAVVLWNYLHILKWDYMNNAGCDKDGIFEEVRQRICEKYPTEEVLNIAEEVKRAISDIKEYDKELRLTEEMKEFYKCYKRTAGKTTDNLIQENNGSWMPIGRIKMWSDTPESSLASVLKLNNGARLYRVSMECKSGKAHYRPIKIKESNGSHYITNYNFDILMGQMWCTLKEETVKYLTPTKHKRKFERFDKYNEVIESALEKLFSDFDVVFDCSQFDTAVLKD